MCSIGNLIYKRLLSEDDADISQLMHIYKSPDVSRYLSISDNYFHYVTNTENVHFYKVYENNKLIGSMNFEKQGNLLFMDILVFPGFQRKGFGTKIIKDIKNDIFKFNYERIEIFIDERNLASIKLFENAGFTFVSKDDELMKFIYLKVN